MNRRARQGLLKRATAVLLAVLLAASLLPPYGDRVEASGWHSPNLVANPGFESYDASTGMPGNWSSWIASGTPSVSVDTSVYAEGAASLRIQADTVSRANVKQTVPVTGGEIYDLSLSVKLDNIVSSDKGAQIRIQYFDQSWNKVGDSAYIVVGTGTKDWHEVTYSAEVPADATRFQIEPFLWLATGSVWFDNVSLLHQGMLTGLLKPTHPRLLADADDFAAIGARVQSDPLAAGWYQKVKADADAMIQEPVVTFSGTGRLLQTARLVHHRMYTLGMAYWLEGDIAYAERAWDELEAVAGFVHWLDSNFLETAEMIHAVAIGYDWFYPYWSESRKDVIKEAIAVKGLIPGLRDYTNERWWTKTVSNWNVVCNGGLAAGALAIGDDPAYRQLAEEVLRKGLDSVQGALQQFAPDGGWYEGPSYWDFTSQYLALYLGGMQSALGTDFGLSNLPGLSETGDYSIYMEGPFQRSFNYSDSGPGRFPSPQLMWLANQYDRPEYQWFRKGALGEAENLLWYRPSAYSGPRKEGMPKDRYFENIDAATFRSAWEDRQALFTGLKGAYHHRSHRQLDAGEFVLDALDVRWADVLGFDDYDMPGYFDFDNQRWSYYRNRAEGTNTIVINPGIGPEQDYNTAAEMIEYGSSVTGGYAIVDLKPLQGPEVLRAHRGIKLLDHRRQFLVQDEVELSEPGHIWWFMHTGANVEEVSADGKTAILQLDGKRLWMRILSSQGQFTVMDAQPLPSSHDPSVQNPNLGMRKVTIHEPDVSHLQLSVLMVPLREWEEPPVALPVTTPLSQWGQETESVSLLQEVTIDGVALDGFMPDTLTYNVMLPAEMTSVPNVAASAAQLGTSVAVTQADAVPGTAWIEVQNPNEAEATRYAVHFQYESDITQDSGLPVQAVAASFSSPQDNNIPENTVDGNYSTIWAVEGDGHWIQYDLGAPTTVRSVSLAWFRGAERRAIFDIEVSDDTQNWTSVFSGTASGETAQLENYGIGEHVTRYIRIVGHGNTNSMWNSVAEARIYDVVIPAPAKPLRLEKVALAANASSLNIGDTTQLTVTGEMSDGTQADLTAMEVTYYSNQPDIIAVTPSGLTEAKAEGTARLTVMVKDGWNIRMSSVDLEAKDRSRVFPLHDTYVRDGVYADQNYGSGYNLIVKSGTPDKGYNRMSYLQFDVSEMPSATERVTLSVYGYVQDPSGTESVTHLHGVADDNWTESTLTWNNRPDAADLVATATFNQTAAWHEYDVTDYVRAEHAGDGIASFALQQTGKGYTTYIHSQIRSDTKPVLQFHADTAAPNIAIDEPVSDGSYLTSDSLLTSFQISDDSSGVDGSYTAATLDGAVIDPSASIPLYTLPLGAHVFTVTARDLAGNAASQSVTFHTAASADSLRSLTLQFSSQRWISSVSLLFSMLRKIYNGDLEGFIALVEANRGGAIAAEAADYLLRDASSLLAP
ncbi:DNRLRE domain-containing protein [Paenibacillus sp. J5C_2022]|nr:DNRLRE domain-containing protein [Paenibacillus sp. J5C2022]